MEEDVECIRCVSLLNKPWSLKDEGLVRELLLGVPNQFDFTMRDKPERWTALAWREKYRFELEGYRWASRTDKYIVGQFQNLINPKDGFAVGDCEDFWTKQVLEFLVLILYPEKPTRVTMTVGNTFFGALLEDRVVDWGLLLSDIVGSMVGLVSKEKLTMVCPYMFHLYNKHQVHLSSKLATYTLQMEIIKYNCTLNSEPILTTSQSGSEPPQPTSTSERRRKQKTSANKQADSTLTVEILSKDAGLSTSKVEKNVQAFDNAIS